MQQQLPKAQVENLVEPASFPPGHGQRPMNDRIALIAFARQPGQIEVPVRSPARETVALVFSGLGLHAGKIKLAYAQGKKLERD